MTPLEEPDPYGSYHGGWDTDGRAHITWSPADGPPQAVEHVVSHSPDGLSWGYAGAGPADTALSILTHAIGERNAAEVHHQQFKRDHIARLPLNQPFTLPGSDVAVWLQSHGLEATMSGVDHGGLDPLAGGDSLSRGEQLDAREADLARRAHDLDQREMRLTREAAAMRAGHVIDEASSLPARPVVGQIRWLVAGTGDSLETVARGLDIEVDYARGLLPPSA